VFDLDDTLYPYRQFVLSGFAAVAAYLERHHGIPSSRALETLKAARRRRPGRELQKLCETFDLPASYVPALVALIRSHRPSLRLPTRSALVLRSLRRHWRLGVLTNGIPSVQVRKVAALGLDRLVDAVVCAVDCGDGRGKPASDGFVEILVRLGTAPDRAVFVGDDPCADVAGATRIGMKTIHVVRGRAPHAAPVPPDAAVASLAEVPTLAAVLVPARESADVV
jgi:putative hydrolase of the HAD superfamily